MAKWKITMVDRKKIFKWLFFRCHASFRGCMCHQNPGKHGLDFWSIINLWSLFCGGHTRMNIAIPSPANIFRTLPITTAHPISWSKFIHHSEVIQAVLLLLQSQKALKQGCRFDPESSRQTLVSPIFSSGLVPSVADSFRKCITGTNLQPWHLVDLYGIMYR